MLVSPLVQYYKAKPLIKVPNAGGFRQGRKQCKKTTAATKTLGVSVENLLDI